MRFRLSVAAGLLAVSASVLAAQAGPGGAPANPSCTGLGGDACQQGVDFFKYMAPQLGTAMTGGNTTLGQGGTLGGPRFGLIPRFALGIRVNAVMGNVPNYNPTLGAPQGNTLTTEDIYLPMPAVDVALGVFKGFPLALSNVGGVDILVSGAYVPKYSNDEIDVQPDNSFAFGYGARIGLLQESLVVPGIGVSYFIRKFPVTTIEATTVTPTPATVTVRDLDLQSNAWRLTLNKNLLLFGIAAGVGQDTYKATTNITSTIFGGTQITVPDLESNVTRTNYFADVTMNLFLLKLVATGGMVSGGDITTFNDYDNKADKSRFYGSVGVRFGL